MTPPRTDGGDSAPRERRGLSLRTAAAGRPSPLPLAAITAAALGCAFVVVESRASQPMLPRVLFHDRARVGALLVIMLVGAVIAGYVYFTSLYLQRLMGFSPLQTGLGLVPATLTVMGSSILLSRALLPRLRVRGMLALGLPVLALGQLWLSFLRPDGSYLVGVFPGLLRTALGMGLVIPTAAFTANSGVPARAGGVAGGLFVTAQQLGSAIGLAVLASLAASSQRSSGNAGQGYSTAFVAASAIAVGAFIVALTLIPQRATSGLRGMG